MNREREKEAKKLPQCRGYRTDGSARFFCTLRQGHAGSHSYWGNAEIADKAMARVTELQAENARLRGAANAARELVEAWDELGMQTVAADIPHLRRLRAAERGIAMAVRAYEAASKPEEGGKP